MKSPHDKSNYEKTDGADFTEKDNAPAAPAKRKPKLSGAYYYVETDEKKLSEFAFIRSLLDIIALLLQTVVLCLPQGSLEYVTLAYPSVSFCYVLAVFVTIGVAIWLLIMHRTRYKFGKRIPVERAPKRGFGRRAFFGDELYIAVNALILVFEIIFICFHFDGVGLAGMLLCALALAAAIAARQVTHIALKNSSLVPAPAAQEEKADEVNE